MCDFNRFSYTIFKLISINFLLKYSLFFIKSCFIEESKLIWLINFIRRDNCPPPLIPISLLHCIVKWSIPTYSIFIFIKIFYFQTTPKHLIDATTIIDGNNSIDRILHATYMIGTSSNIELRVRDSGLRIINPLSFHPSKF